MKCPDCGATDQEGRFCSECGTALAGSCPSCDAAITPGSRFCTACGEPVARSGAPGGSRLPWIIAAAAVIVVLLVLLLPGDTEPVRPPPAGDAGVPFSGTTAPGGAGPGGAANVPLSGDMRTNADRLFRRIMLAAEQGDRAEVERFMPMAVQAYEMVEDLDGDGLYHLAILHLTAGDHAEARRTAQRILDTHPNHILALGVAATAAEAAGDTAAAETMWERLLQVYPEESERALPEYLDHRPMLERYREMAAAAR